jgi:hypothetical protein
LMRPLPCKLYLVSSRDELLASESTTFASVFVCADHQSPHALRLPLATSGSHQQRAASTPPLAPCSPSHRQRRLNFD